LLVKFTLSVIPEKVDTLLLSLYSHPESRTLERNKK